MNDDNIYGGNSLDELDYTASAPKNNGPTGVTAPVLDDMDYVAPSSKKGGPTGVSAPVLDDMDSYSYSGNDKKGAPTGVSAPVLDDDNYSASHEKLVMTDEEIINGLSPEQKSVFDTLPQEQRQQIIDMRRSQLGASAPVSAAAAPILDEDNYVPPPKKEEPPKPAAPVTAPVLDDEPEAPTYKPKYVDEDLERAKAEAKKKAVAAQLVPDQKDSKESLRKMLELKDEIRLEKAAKGAKICIVLAIVGIIGAIAFYLLYTGALGLDYKNGAEGMAGFMQDFAMYICIAMVFSAAGLITGVSFIKSIASVVYLISGIVQLIGAVLIPQHDGSMTLVVLLYAVSLICTVAVFFTLSSNECVGQRFKKE